MDFKDFVVWGEKVPILSIAIAFLKKIDFIKDYERLYRTENKVKALGNSFRKINVPFEKILEKNNLVIPCLILFRQKDKILTPDKLRAVGFKAFHRSMGIYVLPPLDVVRYKIKDKSSIMDFLVREFGFNNDAKTNLRFCVLVDLNKQYFSFRHASINNKETKPIFDLIQEDIIKYLGEKRALRYVKEFYKKDWSKKESEIIASTPLQHVTCDYLDNENFAKIAANEQEILEYMKKRGFIEDFSFLSLSKLSIISLKETLDHFDLVVVGDIRNTCKEIVKQADFMANRL